MDTKVTGMTSTYIKTITSMIKYNKTDVTIILMTVQHTHTFYGCFRESDHLPRPHPHQSQSGAATSEPQAFSTLLLDEKEEFERQGRI